MTSQPTEKKLSGWLIGAPTELNVAKTKEMIRDFRKNKTAMTPLAIREQQVELVDSLKFLGTTIANILN